MRTLGTPTQLRLQFDQGYKFMLAVDAPENEASPTLTASTPTLTLTLTLTRPSPSPSPCP